MSPKFLILVLVLFLCGSVADAAFYPTQTHTGKTVKSYGNTTYLMVPGVQAIGPAENSDDDQIFDATFGLLNNTVNLIVTSSGVHSSGFLAQPDVPRNIIGTVNATTTCSVKITGTDIANSVITENLTWTSESGVKATTRAFKTVTRVDADLATGQDPKTLKLGTGNVLGLNQLLGDLDQVIATYVNGAVETTPAAVRKSTTDLASNTVDTYSAPGGYITIVYYLLRG